MNKINPCDNNPSKDDYPELSKYRQPKLHIIRIPSSDFQKDLNDALNKDSE